MPDLATLTTLHCILEGPVAILTLDRPEVLHALNSVMFDELEFAFTTLPLKVIPLETTGAGR